MSSRLRTYFIFCAILNVYFFGHDSRLWDKKIHWFSMMLLIRKLLVELNTHSNNISIEIFVQDYVH